MPRPFPLQDEKDRIVNDIREWVTATGGNPTKDGCYAAFVNRVRDNLHLVLAMSPVGEAFRSRCRQFPSLINCTTIDWFSAWPEVRRHSGGAVANACALEL